MFGYMRVVICHVWQHNRKLDLSFQVFLREPWFYWQIQMIKLKVILVTAAAEEEGKTSSGVLKGFHQRVSANYVLVHPNSSSHVDSWCKKLLVCIPVRHSFVKNCFFCLAHVVIQTMLRKFMKHWCRSFSSIPDWILVFWQSHSIFFLQVASLLLA